MGYKNEFNAIKDGSLSGLQLQNFIEKVTNGELEKLELLYQDFTEEYDKQVWEMEKKFSHTERAAAVKKARKNNQRIYKWSTESLFQLSELNPIMTPLEVLPADYKLCSFRRYLQIANRIIGDYDNQPIDLEKLLFPDEFIRIRQALYHVKQIMKEASGEHRESALPRPISVAQSFLSNSKYSKYTIEVIALAMSYARNYRHENNYMEIIRKFLEDVECPPTLSISNYNTIQNWIKVYDKATGIVRKRNP